jgi:hypothetical protein
MNSHNIDKIWCFWGLVMKHEHAILGSFATLRRTLETRTNVYILGIPCIRFSRRRFLPLPLPKGHSVTPCTETCQSCGIIGGSLDWLIESGDELNSLGTIAASPSLMDGTFELV